MGAGKIYVENERARLTHRLAKIHEKDGKVEEAAKIMQELQVETYGSMERQEKVELILEQMRLCLLTQDYIRAQIISKKISVRFFENQKYHELKLKFYGYMIELGQHEHDYLGICKHYRSVQDTDSVREDMPTLLNKLRNIVLYVVLAKHDNEQSDLLHRVAEECLSDMVVAGTVSAKTDRLEGIVDFTEQQDPLEALNSWSSNTNKLMDLVM